MPEKTPEKRLPGQKEPLRKRLLKFKKLYREYISRRRKKFSNTYVVVPCATASKSYDWDVRNSQKWPENSHF